MAIINSLAVGKAVGSMGNLTYSTQDGRVIVKQKVVSVKDAMSPAQLIQRDKLSVTVKLWRAFQGTLKQYWTRRDKYLSAYNQFVSSNIDNANDTVLYNSETGIITQTHFQIARGYFSHFGIILTKGAGATRFDVEIPDSEIRDNLKTGDSLVFYNADKKDVFTHVLSEEEISNLKDYGTVDKIFVEVPETWLNNKFGVIYKSIDGCNLDAFSDMYELTA